MSHGPPDLLSDDVERVPPPCLQCKQVINSRHPRYDPLQCRKCGFCVHAHCFYGECDDAETELGRGDSWLCPTCRAQAGGGTSAPKSASGSAGAGGAAGARPLDSMEALQRYMMMENIIGCECCVSHCDESPVYFCPAEVPTRSDGRGPRRVCGRGLCETHREVQWGKMDAKLFCPVCRDENPPWSHYKNLEELANLELALRKSVGTK